MIRFSYVNWLTSRRLNQRIKALSNTNLKSRKRSVGPVIFPFNSHRYRGSEERQRLKGELFFEVAGPGSFPKLLPESGDPGDRQGLC